jgi:hypothetical protein
MDINANKKAPKHLTPVTIMVVDTIKIMDFVEGFAGLRFNNNYD